LRRSVPGVQTYAVGVRSSKATAVGTVFLNMIANNIKERSLVVTFGNLLVKEFLLTALNLICDAAPGDRCGPHVADPALAFQRQPFNPPKKVDQPDNIQFPGTRNNDKYVPYKSTLDAPWYAEIIDIPSLELNSFHFDSVNFIEVVQQSAKAPFIVEDVLSGIDIRTGNVVWGPSVTGHRNSRFIGVAFGFSWFIGRTMPPYYSQVAANFADARYDIYAVNTKNGKVEASRRLAVDSYDERSAQQTSLACMSEQTGYFYTVEEGIINGYGIGLENRDGGVFPYIDLNWRTTGNPVYHRNPNPPSDATGIPLHDKCTIIGDNFMGYIGDSSRDVGAKQRFHLVNSADGKRVWGETPNNDLTATGHLNYAVASAYRNGTVIITGHAFYTIVDPNGNGRNVALSGDGRAYSFPISLRDEQTTISYDGNFLFRQGLKVDVANDFSHQLILHEKTNSILLFKRNKLATGGKIYDVATGTLNQNVPSFWEGEIDDRIFWEDAVFTISFLDTQTLAQGFSPRFIKLTGIPTSKSQFKQSNDAGHVQDQGVKRTVE